MINKKVLLEQIGMGTLQKQVFKIQQKESYTHKVSAVQHISQTPKLTDQIL